MSNAPPLPQPSGYTCPYCGAGWDNTLPTCPKCGRELPRQELAEKYNAFEFFVYSCVTAGFAVLGFVLVFSNRMVISGSPAEMRINLIMGVLILVMVVIALLSLLRRRP